MGSCRDLSNLHDSEKIQDAFSKLVSGGKPGYKTIIEKSKQVERCDNCGNILNGNEKFCPECGNKII
jgi:rubrerythrin